MNSPWGERRRTARSGAIVRHEDRAGGLPLRILAGTEREPDGGAGRRSRPVEIRPGHGRHHAAARGRGPGCRKAAAAGGGAVTRVLRISSHLSADWFIGRVPRGPTAHLPLIVPTDSPTRKRAAARARRDRCARVEECMYPNSKTFESIRWSSVLASLLLLGVGCSAERVPAEGGRRCGWMWRPWAWRT